MDHRGVRMLVLDVEGPVDRAGRLLAERYPDVQWDSRRLRLAIGADRTPEAVLASCLERGIGVRGSRVRSREPGGFRALHGASASPASREVGR